MTIRRLVAFRRFMLVAAGCALGLVAGAPVARGEDAPMASDEFAADIARLRAADRDERFAALSRLQRGKRPAAVALARRLSSADPEERRASAWALQGLFADAEPAIESLVAMLASESDEKAIRWCVAALGGLPTSEPRLYELLRRTDPPAPVRARVLRALTAQHSADAILEVTRGLDSTDPDWRRAAAWAAGEIGKAGRAGRPAGPQLVRALADPDPPVRAGAARSLGMIGESTPVALHALRALLADAELEVRRHAAFALVDLHADDEAVMPVLLDALHDAKDMRWREAAAKAFGELRAGTVIPADALLAVLRQPDRGFADTVRLHAAASLASMGHADVEVVQELLTWADDSIRSTSGDVGAEARTALGKLGEAAIVPLSSAIADQRRGPAAVAALLRLGARGAQVVGEALLGGGHAERWAALVGIKKAGPRAAAVLPYLRRAIDGERDDGQGRDSDFAEAWFAVADHDARLAAARGDLGPRLRAAAAARRSRDVPADEAEASVAGNLAVLADRSQAARSAAFDALERAPAAAVPVLVKTARDASSPLWLPAIEALKRRNDGLFAIAGLLDVPHARGAALDVLVESLVRRRDRYASPERAESDPVAIAIVGNAHVLLVDSATRIRALSLLTAISGAAAPAEADVAALVAAGPSPVARRALDVLAAIGTAKPATIEAIERLAVAAGPETACRAAETLDAVGAPANVRASAWARVAGTTERVLAARVEKGLAAPGPSAAGLLDGLFGSSDPIVRVRALRLLPAAGLGAEVARAKVRPFVADVDPSVRAAALDAMLLAGPLTDEMAAMLVARIRDGDLGVRDDRDAANDTLIRVLSSARAPRRDVFDALYVAPKRSSGRRGDDEYDAYRSRERLVAVVRAVPAAFDDALARLAAAGPDGPLALSAVAETGRPEAAAAIAAALSGSKDENLRREAAAALQHGFDWTATPVVVTSLLAALADADSSVATAALRTLCQSGERIAAHRAVIAAAASRLYDDLDDATAEQVERALNEMRDGGRTRRGR
jgi:HEAT repeat protein